MGAEGDDPCVDRKHNRLGNLRCCSGCQNKMRTSLVTMVVMIVMGTMMLPNHHHIIVIIVIIMTIMTMLSCLRPQLLCCYVPVSC